MRCAPLNDSRMSTVFFVKIQTALHGAQEFPLVYVYTMCERFTDVIAAWVRGTRCGRGTMCERFTDVITAWHPLRPRRTTPSDSTSVLSPPPCLVASASVHSLASHAPRVLSSSRRVRRQPWRCSSPQCQCLPWQRTPSRRSHRTVERPAGCTSTRSQSAADASAGRRRPRRWQGR